ncbi:MAG: ABC transporter ATP-binding protein/permease [Anaerolineae bacterium]|nr:ABC transporter ATP-binding protein/permease [Anaerolineae bacterium]
MHGGNWHTFMHATDEKPKVSWPLLRRVLAYARPYGWSITGMLILILTHTGLSLLTPLILRELIDHTIPGGDLQRLAWLTLGLLSIPAISGLVAVFQRRLNTVVGEGVIYDLRVALYSHLQRMSLRFFTNTRVGELMSRLNNDVIGAQNAISNTIVDIITNLIQAVGVGIVMFSMEWRLTLISLVFMPLFILAARRLADHLRDVAHQQMDANARMNAMMMETLNIGGILLVKLFGRSRDEVGRFEERAGEVRRLGVLRAVSTSFFIAVIGLVSAFGTALVYGLGGYFVIQGAFTVGTIVAFGSYLGVLYAALQDLAGAPVEFATSVVSFERVFEVLDLPLEISEKPSALILQDCFGNLRFEDVSFKYEVNADGMLSEVRRFGRMTDVQAVLSDAETRTVTSGRSQARESALEHIDFEVQAGQLLALVGPSGAGKTTLTYLVPRLYDPSEGHILLDGYDLRDLNLDSLSSQIGMVTQETHLFHDSIRTNLLYARLNATQAELEAAAKAANIHDFICDLPAGYDTVVGERGYRLSGGEKQRIALARVILKNPRILVLDEATSSLDSESESLIQEALKRVMAGRTSIVIAHRLSTILAADKILVMDRGRIVEQGKHADLLALNGLYAHLYHTQFDQGLEEGVR